MQNIVCLDASPLINYYRKTIKEKSFYFRLSKEYETFVLPVAAHYEILCGARTPQQIVYWENFFAEILIVPYQTPIDYTAVKIVNQLKAKRKSIEFKDLLIAATALNYNYSLATRNTRHFQDVDGLNLITPTFLES